MVGLAEKLDKFWSEWLKNWTKRLKSGKNWRFYDVCACIYFEKWYNMSSEQKMVQVFLLIYLAKIVKLFCVKLYLVRSFYPMNNHSVFFRVGPYLILFF